MPMRKEEKQRLEREEMEAKGFVPNLERLLVAVDDSANGQFASRVAGMIAGTHGMPTTVMHITDRQDRETEPSKKATQVEPRQPRKRPRKEERSEREVRQEKRPK